MYGFTSKQQQEEKKSLGDIYIYIFAPVSPRLPEYISFPPRRFLLLYPLEDEGALQPLRERTFF